MTDERKTYITLNLSDRNLILHKKEKENSFIVTLTFGGETFEN